ncbi:PIG-L deacetylase family protein [Plantactinospora sp. WMMB782]|uniref:PIG-L deacetylase family protein n=1 Tax=Plantactinospora sp. WMMB782 TaxID=3404121 RepID=UPI003B922F27
MTSPPETSSARDATILVVSPHLDDAVLSAGATIAASVDAGTRVVVCTVFAAQPAGTLSPVAEEFHRSCGLPPDAAAVRRGEDARAVRTLGAQYRHLDFADAVYRRVGDRWLCRHGQAMFDADPRAERDLGERLVGDLTRLTAALAPCQVWTCAGYGGHVDHLITRAAAVRVAAGLTTAGAPVALLLWEDLPYGIWEPVAAVADRSPALPPVGVHHLARKFAAIACYRSQLGMLWPDGGWRRDLLRHARRRWPGAELLWTADGGADEHPAVPDPPPVAGLRRPVPDQTQRRWLNAR